MLLAPNYCLYEFIKFRSKFRWSTIFEGWVAAICAEDMLVEVDKSIKSGVNG